MEKQRKVIRKQEVLIEEMKRYIDNKEDKSPSKPIKMLSMLAYY